MSDNMSAALEMLPQPAALFEWPDLGEAIALNRAGIRWRMEDNDVLDGGPVLKWLDIIDANVREQLRTGDGEPVLLDHERHGPLVLSIIPSRTQHSRPPLMLITIHRGREATHAKLDHVRMLTALEVNEATEIAQRLLESALQQVAAVMESQQDMLKSFNELAARLLASSAPDPEK